MVGDVTEPLYRTLLLPCEFHNGSAYVRLSVAEQALDEAANRIAELEGAALSLVGLIDRLAPGQCGPFAIQNSIANSSEMEAIRAALSPQDEVIGGTK